MFLTTSEVGKRLRYSTEHVRWLISKGKLRAVKLHSGHLRVEESEVERMLQPSPDEANRR